MAFKPGIGRQLILVWPAGIRPRHLEHSTLPPVHAGLACAYYLQFGGVPTVPGGQAAGAGLQFGGVPT